MKNKKITMFSEKRYELEELRNDIVEETNRRPLMSIEFRNEIYRNHGNVKMLTLVFDRYSMRIEGYATLIVSFSEHEGNQFVDLVAAGGKEIIFDLGVEKDFLCWAFNYLSKYGFKEQEIS